MDAGEVDWAGVRFLPLHHHDGRFFRQPGLFAFVRLHASGERTLLYVDHADNIASAVHHHPLWVDALRLGMNELHINLQAVERIDRLILRGHIIKRCEPVLNVIMGEAETEAELTATPGRASAV